MVNASHRNTERSGGGAAALALEEQGKQINFICISFRIYIRNAGDLHRSSGIDMGRQENRIEWRKSQTLIKMGNHSRRSRSNSTGIKEKKLQLEKLVVQTWWWSLEISSCPVFLAVGLYSYDHHYPLSSVEWRSMMSLVSLLCSQLFVPVWRGGEEEIIFLLIFNLLPRFYFNLFHIIFIL